MSEKELDSSVNEYEEQYKSTNYIKQLPEYIKRYESTYAFYVIVIVMGGTDIEQFYKTKKENHSNCNIFEIDGRIKESPSKL